MMPETPPMAAPYAHNHRSVASTMLRVIVALLPATAVALFQYGWPAIYLFLITLASALLFESLSLWLMGRPQQRFLTDGSALLTGWLLAMTLPPWAPWWIGVVGAFLAIVVGKQVFGGLGQNLFNPAMVARVALLISFPLEMTRFIPPQPLTSAAAPDAVASLAITFGTSPLPDAISGATPLGYIKTELSRGTTLDAAIANTDSLPQLLLGNSSGSLGEGSALLLLIGGLFLLYWRIIRWHIPVAMLTTIGVLAALLHHIDPTRYGDALFHLSSGGVMLGAFFIATDLVTSPLSVRGQLLFGVGCGLLTYLIRGFAGYPEGVAFAVLLMNGCTPLIDHYLRPRIYGRDRRGQQLNSDREGAA